ncbi:MAG TPA: NTP transferase domain-containing protein [Lunatimonas sp.]|nr:NTP transferase domain-containing protein [Lunatimonas sp.]
MTSPGNNQLNGLILIGGGSTRMGIDKSTLQYHVRNQRDHLIQLLSPICSRVFISCNEVQAAELGDSYSVLQDIFEGIGPIGGVHAAFEKSPEAAWLVVACDLPLLSAGTLSHLISHRQKEKQATAFRSGENGFPEPLLAIYEPDAFPEIALGIQSGQYSPSKILLKMDVAWLDAPDENELKNVNDPEGYRRTLGEIRSPLK